MADWGGVVSSVGPDGVALAHRQIPEITDEGEEGGLGDDEEQRVAIGGKDHLNRLQEEEEPAPYAGEEGAAAIRGALDEAQAAGGE